MNQISRALGWLRDSLILTQQELPQQLDSSGGVKPTVDVMGNAEPFGWWRTGIKTIGPGDVGRLALPGIPGPESLLLFPPRQGPVDQQCIIHSMAIVKSGAAAETVQLIIGGPNDQTFFRLIPVAVPAANGVVSWKELTGDPTKRLVIPPLCTLTVQALTVIPAGQQVDISYLYTIVPSGLRVIF